MNQPNPVPVPPDQPPPNPPNIAHHVTATTVGTMSALLSFWLINKQHLDPTTAATVVGGVGITVTAITKWVIERLNQWADVVLGERKR